MNRRAIRQALNNIPAYKLFASTLPAVNPATVYPYGQQGLNGGNHQDIVNDAGFIGSTSAGWVRVNFSLNGASSWTQAVLDSYDAVVNVFIQSGITILGLMAGSSFSPGSQTNYVANNAEHLGGDGNNATIQAFAAAAKKVAAYFYPRVQNWEIWNEPDAWSSNPSDAIYTGGTFIYPSNFSQLLSQCYSAIKAISPANISVISGGLFVNDLGVSIGSFDTTYYIPNLLSYGFTADFLGEHIYIDQTGSTTSAHMQTACDVVHNLVGVPTWITEVGWTLDSVSQAVQAANLAIAYQIFKANSYIKRAFWFKVKGAAGSNYGLYDANGNANQSLAAFKQNAFY